MKKENLKEKLKKYQTYVLALLLVVSVAGITYAAFVITRESGENTISTGQISMSYTEQDNTYVVEDALPIKDAEAMAINNYFEFTVSSHATTNADDEEGLVIPYEISLGELAIDSGKSKLTKDQIKVYITKVESGKEIAVNGPVLLSELAISTKRDDASVIYNATDIHKNASSKITTTYRVRAWIDYNVDASNFTKDNRYQYKFNVNVNSMVGAKDYYNYCFGTSKITDDSGKVIGVSVDNYYCYEGNGRGYEVRTDVIIPNSFDTYQLAENPSESAVLTCKKSLMDALGVPEEEEVLVTALCNGENIEGLTLIELVEQADSVGLNISTELLNVGLITKTSLPTINIGEYAANYKNLTSVIIPDGVTTIEDYAFESNKLTNVVIPDSVTTIGQDAFSYNNLTSVIIPDGVTTIGYDAFKYNNLTNVVIPNSVTTIEQSAFENNMLTSVVIPNKLTTIRKFAFMHNNLNSVIIPNSVTTIEESAFSDNKLTNLVIPESVTTIDDGAFSTNNLTSIVISDSVITIGYAAFANNKLTSVVIPRSVTTIDDMAFSNNNLTNVTISDGVTTIGYRTFENNRLTNVVIPGSVTTIGSEAFLNNNLTSIVISDGVTTIKGAAFSDNKLTSIVIPDSVTTIGRNAFSGNNLTSVVIGENSQLTNSTIDDGAFYSSGIESNPNLTIYNNSGKSFDWSRIVYGRYSGKLFETGTVPVFDENNNEVIIKKGYPE